MSFIIALGQGFTKVYHKNQAQFDIIFKFAAGLLVFFLISTLGTGAVGGGKKAAVTVICAAATVIAPPTVFLLLCAFVCCFYVAALSIEAAAILFLLFFLIFVFYIGLFPKESLVIPVMLCAYFLKIPYIVPVFAGLYMGLKAVIPVGVAVFFQYNTHLLKGMIELAPRETFTPLGVLDTGLKIYEYVSVELIQNTGWFYIAIVLMLSVAAGWIMNSLFVDNERLVAVIVSGLVIVLGLISAKYLGDAEISLIEIMISPLVCCVLVYMTASIDFVLDYDSAQKVKFQDDKYFYYVKAVPKIDFTKED
ncbi:MAG: hypothetical protein HFE62_05210 [Firmicutes bacterium]|nr:hypothetical protein [Bacillota bacterium]